MKTSDLQYDLPPQCIAQRPCRPRDAAKLMVLHRAAGRIEHRTFRELPSLLRSGDYLVRNVTKVLPARFEARRATGGRIEGLFLHEESPGRWRVLLTGVGRLRNGEVLSMGDGSWTLRLEHRHERGESTVLVSPPTSAHEVLDRVGTMPLPPYIRREGEDRARLDADDRNDYQTVYAAHPGAVASPTAGLHFTPQLLEQIKQMGIAIADVVLHVGLGTFQPVEVQDLADHHMHAEWFSLSQDAVQAIESHRSRNGRVIAVGTTAVRVLESAARDGPLAPRSGWTDIFIYPPHSFRAVDGLITNFHLPGSTLLALVCAFAGRESVLNAYHIAVEKGYRFYSFGDAMLIT